MSGLQYILHYRERKEPDIVTGILFFCIITGSGCGIRGRLRCLCFK